MKDDALLDSFMPTFDISETQVCRGRVPRAALVQAIKTHDVSRHTVGLATAWTLLRRFLPPARRDGATLLQLGRLHDVAMEDMAEGLVLGFIGPIWRFNAQLTLPTTAFFCESARHPSRWAHVVWRLFAASSGPMSEAVLMMRVRAPQAGPEGDAFKRYWARVQRPSAWARAYLLRCIMWRAAA